MMLGSVFNRYHASTTSESSRPQTKLRTFKIGRDTCPFSEFKALGPPGLNIGLPGDIYIDLTPGDHALYARYPDSWRLWPGPKDGSILLLHPTHSDRCLWCNETIGWYHRKSIKVNPSGTASELLSETLKHQVTLAEESRKRKREALGQAHQPMQTTSSSTTNVSGPSQNRALQSQSPTDGLSFLRSTTSTTPGYSPPTLETMTYSALIPTTSPNMQNSEHCTGPPTADSIPTETDHVFTSNERSERNLQERCTSPKRIDLREFTKKRKSTSSTHGLDARSILYQRNVTQISPQPGSVSPRPRVRNKPSIQDPAYATNLDILSSPEASRIPLNDYSLLDQYTIANSTLIFGKSLANNASPANKSISFSLSHNTRERLIEKSLHDPASLASTNHEEPQITESPFKKPTLENPIDDRGIPHTSIAELRRMSDPPDTNAAYVRAANDKIRRLEAENAQLRARLLNPCQCSLSSRDIPSPASAIYFILKASDNNHHLSILIPIHKQVADVDIPPAVDSDVLNCSLDIHGGQILFGVSQPPRETVGNIPPDSQPHPECHPYKELGSSPTPRVSATPPTSLSLADTTVLTETTPSAHAILLLEPENHRNIIDIVQDVRGGTSSLEDCKTPSVNSPPVKEEIADPKTWHASSSDPTSMRMREIHRSVLFAKAGSLLICRICLGTKLGGIETLDQTFKTTEGSPELMQEHCEKEHPRDCEALMSMRDEELLELVSMITTE